MLGAARIEDLRERHGRQHQRLAEAGEVARQSHHDLEPEDGHHPRPAYRRHHHPTQQQVEDAEPDECGRQNRLREQRVLPGQLLQDAGRQERSRVDREQRVEANDRSVDPFDLPSTADEADADPHPGCQAQDATQAHQHHRPVVRGGDGRERPSHQRAVEDANGDLHPLEGDRQEQHGRPGRPLQELIGQREHRHGRTRDPVPHPGGGPDGRGQIER